MAKILKKGVAVKCPRKAHLIGYLNRNFNIRDVPRFNFIDFEYGQEKIAGEQPECALCGSKYFVQNKIYVKQGWFPSDPNLETPTTTKR